MGYDSFGHILNTIIAASLIATATVMINTRELVITMNERLDITIGELSQTVEELYILKKQVYENPQTGRSP